MSHDFVDGEGNSPADLTDDEVLTRATILARHFKDNGITPDDLADVAYSDALIDQIHERNLSWGGEDHEIEGDDEYDIEGADDDALADVTYEVTITLGAYDPLPTETELETLIVEGLNTTDRASVDSVRVRRQ